MVGTQLAPNPQVEALREHARAICRTLVDNTTLVDKLCYLKDRWQDEHEFEDFNEYINAIKPVIPESFTFVKLVKRPWSLSVTTTDKRFKGAVFMVAIKGNRISGSYRRA